MPGMLYENYVLNASQESRAGFHHSGSSASMRNITLIPLLPLLLALIEYAVFNRSSCKRPRITIFLALLHIIVRIFISLITTYTFNDNEHYNKSCKRMLCC